MNTEITIHFATASDAQDLAILVDELLTEVSDAIGVQAFKYNLEETAINAKNLIEQKKDFGRSIGWKRLEVTTPPLPQFDKTLAFYKREGFANSGGLKLRFEL